MPTPNVDSRVQQRLAQGFETLEAIQRERTEMHDLLIGKALEQRIVHRELLELELQDLDEQMDRIRAATAGLGNG